MKHPQPQGEGRTARNIEAVAGLEREAIHDRSQWQRLTDIVTGVAGSPAFIIVHAMWFTAWIVLNRLRATPFDPYPFDLLTLIVSLEAIFLTSFVLMTQNRMTAQSDRRAHLDLQVNMLAEQELTAMLQMLFALCRRSGVDVDIRDEQIRDLLKDTDIHQIAVAVDRDVVKPPAPE